MCGIIRGMRVFLCLWLLGAAPLAQADCPAAPDHSARLSELITSVQIAPDERAAQLLSNSMWELWADAPDDKAQRMLDDGMSRRQSFDLDGAIWHFEQLIDYCPDYAEGYNQRAFARFLKGDYEGALPDLNAALQRAPRHIGALSGKAMTLMGLGRNDEAQEVLRAAVMLNPWLKERHMLQGDPPKPQTDL